MGKFEKNDILGSIAPIEEESVFSFVGSSSPKLRIYKKGELSYILKNPNIKGNIFLVSPEVEEGFSIIKTGTGKTSLDKTFQLTEPEIKSVLSQIQTSKVTEEIIKPTKLNILGSGNILDVQETISSKTESNILSPSYLETQQIKTDEKEVIKPKQISFFGERTEEKIIQKPSQDIFQVEENKFIQPTKEIQKEIIKENQRENFLQLQTTRQKQEEKQRQKIIQKQISRQPLKERGRGVPIWLDKFKNNLKGKQTGEDSFSVFGKRFGKDIKLFETTSKEKGTEKLLSFLKGTLGRSGYISKNGEKLSFEELGLSNEFRPSKKDKKRVVQKSEFSLGSFGERKEIQYFKKKSSKKNKKFGWFD